MKKLTANEFIIKIKEIVNNWTNNKYIFSSLNILEELKTQKIASDEKYIDMILETLLNNNKMDGYTRTLTFVERNNSLATQFVYHRSDICSVDYVIE